MYDVPIKEGIQITVPFILFYFINEDCLYVRNWKKTRVSSGTKTDIIFDNLLLLSHSKASHLANYSI